MNSPEYKFWVSSENISLIRIRGNPSEWLNSLEGKLYENTWPTFDEEKTIDDVIEMPIQVNGKVRGKIEVNADDTQDMVREKAMADENIAKFLEDKNIIKEIFVMGKIYNIVVK